MSETQDWFSTYNQTMANWIALQNSNRDYELGTRTLETNEEIAKAQLELAEKEYYSNYDIMNKNFSLASANYEYNKKQAEITRMREDNAFQRRVADTVKAGFSPLATEGVASASQSPALTAPQLDPQGVNQATANRLSAYNSKMQSNNVSQQLKLQSQQLKLAQIETITETLQAVQNLRSQSVINERNKIALDWEKEHGYKESSIDTIISDIIKGVNVKGKSLGQLGADGINYALDKVLNNSSNASKYGTGAVALLSSKLLSSGSKSGSSKSGSSKSGSSTPFDNNKLSKKQISSLMHSFEQNWFDKAKFNGNKKRVSSLGKDDIVQLRHIANLIGWRGPDNILPDDATTISFSQWHMLLDSYYKHREEMYRQGWL